jgi:hypothetical protein
MHLRLKAWTFKSYVETTIKFSFHIEYLFQGKYKIFHILPALSIVRNTQLVTFDGEHSWEFYFEWLGFLIAFEIIFVKNEL